MADFFVVILLRRGGGAVQHVSTTILKTDNQEQEKRLQSGTVFQWSAIFQFEDTNPRDIVPEG
jgi:hypothetical protein